MTASEKKQLMANACKVRMGVIESTYGAKSGHPGGSLSASDLFTYLYFREMKVDPADPKWEERDRFVLSKGHTAPGLYAALALKGFFPWEELKTLRHIGSRLQGHPNMNETPGAGYRFLRGACQHKVPQQFRRRPCATFPECFPAHVPQLYE